MGIDYEDAIREARSHGYYPLEISRTDGGHVLKLDGSRMLSFRHDEKCGGVSIKVYHKTDSPQKGEHQLFRRNMTLEDLKKILMDPITYTDKGYYRIPITGFKYNEARSMAVPSCIWRFQNVHTTNFFRGIIKESIDSITLGLDSFIILYTDGDTAWSGLPKRLHNKLKGRKRWLPRPEVIALGLQSPESYFLQFADGEASWQDLPDDLEAAIQESYEQVDLITIGGNDEFYVRFKDGNEVWDLPMDLSNLLNGRNGTRRGNPNLGEVKRISLSDQGEWIVGFSDGQWVWSSSNSSIEEVKNYVHSCDEILEFQMGSDQSYVFLYDNK